MSTLTPGDGFASLVLSRAPLLTVVALAVLWTLALIQAVFFALSVALWVRRARRLPRRGRGRR